jgi:hypothetical protein
MNESPIHVRLGYNETIESKKSILITEEELLETIKTIKRYKNLRIEELRIKDIIYKRTKEIMIGIRKLEKLFPKIEEKNKKENKKEEKKEEPKEDIEIQLQEIRSRLKSLGR